jgi:hypothetical protein
MRFARLHEKEDNSDIPQPEITKSFSLIRMAYNLAFWLFLPPFLTDKVDYSFGFVAFTIVILIRLALNLYTNNFLEQTPERYNNFPFRIP